MMLIDERKKLINAKTLCETNNRLENALKEVSFNDSLNDEEVLMSHEKINALEY